MEDGWQEIPSALLEVSGPLDAPPPEGSPLQEVQRQHATDEEHANGVLEPNGCNGSVQAEPQHPGDPSSSCLKLPI
jgi:hypothetical protein